MTEALRLTPKIERRRDTPQCCVEVKETEYQERMNWRRLHYGRNPRKDPMLCQRKATFQIDGKPYCRGHAGEVCLGILLGEEP